MLSPNIEYDKRSPINIYREIVVGKRLVLMGTSSSGPLYEPRPIFNEKVAESEYGYGSLLSRYEDVSVFDESIEVFFLRIEEDQVQKGLTSLLNFNFDLLYIDSFNFGSSKEDIYFFIDFCKEKEAMGSLVHGFFDIEEDADISYINELLLYLSFEDISETYEDGKYLSLVYDHIDGHKAGALYAGLVTSLDPGISPVNKEVEVELRKEFEKHELISLHNNGIVAFRKNNKEKIVASNATCAVLTPNSNHKNIANFRIAQSILQELSEEFQDLIGEPYYGGYGVEEKVKDIIDEKIDEYTDRDIIREAQYSVTSDPPNGDIFITIELVPIFSLDYIRSYSQVRIYR